MKNGFDVDDDSSIKESFAMTFAMLLILYMIISALLFFFNAIDPLYTNGAYQCDPFFKKPSSYAFPFSDVGCRAGIYFKTGMHYKEYKDHVLRSKTDKEFLRVAKCKEKKKEFNSSMKLLLTANTTTVSYLYDPGSCEPRKVE